MNKGDLVEAMAKGADISKAQAEKALKALTENTMKAVKKGDKVTLVGFGTFSSSERAARTGRNPQTGAAIKIPKRKVVKFKAGKEFSEKVK